MPKNLNSSELAKELTKRFLLFSFTLFGFAAPAASEKITVYAYDSFCSKEGLGPVLAKAAKAVGIETEFVVFGDAGEALNQVEMEGAKTRADLVVGVDASLAPRAHRSGSFAAIPEKLFTRIPKELRWDVKQRFIPFDYSWIALVYDSSRTDAAKLQNLSLVEFAKHPEFQKRMVIEDPRTSSVGRMFLLATAQTLGEGTFDSFWTSSKSKWMTITPSWSTAYGMFLKKEVDFALSYTTSPAYHCTHEKNESFRSVGFSEGNILQAEAVGLVAASKHREAALKWIEVLLSPEVQTQVPTTQWMYPVNREAALPKCFANLAKPKRSIIPDLKVAEVLTSKWIPRWVELQALSK